MIELRGRWIAAACALATVSLTTCALTATVALAAPMIQGDGPMINGVETTLAQTVTSSNDAQSNTDVSQAETKPGTVNETSNTSW